MLINRYNQPIPNYQTQHDNSSFIDRNVFMVLPDLNPFYVFENNVEIKNIEEYVPFDIVDKVYKKEIILAFETSTESIYRHIDILYDRLVVEQNVPESQILVISSSYDVFEKILEKAKSTNKQPCLFENYMHFEDVTNNMLVNDLPINYKSPLEKESHPKRYINLNGGWRHHRLTLFTLLSAAGLLDKGYNSFFKPTNYYDKNLDETMMKHDNLNAVSVPTKIAGRLWFNYSKDDSIDDLWKIWMDECKLKFNDTYIRNMLDKGSDVYKQIPMHVDKNPTSLFLFDYYLPRGSLMRLANYYHKALFSVVTDTFFFNTEPRFITEKTMKPVAFKHPFILVAPPNSLDELKKIGYKTFHPYIDESYDREYDDNKRMLMILNEIKRLSDIQDSDLDDFKTNLLPIVNHNFDLLYNRTKFIY